MSVFIRNNVMVLKGLVVVLKKLNKVYYLIKSQIQIPKNPLYNLTGSGKRMHDNIITL